MKIVLENMRYEKNNWTIYVDMNVIGLILGLQGVYSKYLCFFASLKVTFECEK